MCEEKKLYFPKMNLISAKSKSALTIIISNVNKSYKNNASSGQINDDK